MLLITLRIFVFRLWQRSSRARFGLRNKDAFRSFRQNAELFAETANNVVDQQIDVGMHNICLNYYSKHYVFVILAEYAISLAA